MPYYRFRQNNSGGYLREPARNVFIEAESEAEARDIFITIRGCYFDPDFRRDCACCGNRWTESICDEYVNDYDLMRAIEEDLKNRYDWDINKKDVPFALIKGRIKDTLIP